MSYNAEVIGLYMQKQIKVCNKYPETLFIFLKQSLCYQTKFSASKTKKLQFAKKKFET